MSHLIHVQPAPEQRRAFAVWATQQTPKVRTVSPSVFAVPAGLFTAVPEEVLIGSTVDGHRYVSPYEDEPGQPPTALVGEQGPELLVPMREAVPGDRLPDLPEGAYGPDSVPLAPPDFAPLEDAPAADEGDDEGDHGGDDVPADGAHVCEDCGRSYASDRGLATHRRKKHGKGA
ncbi:hypothetical protein [Streptomyces sp. 2P-4]|uniref:hypothetical protein n=1 Tax=Streptomyces sp. 2P-4 TaxID=2931974 RepID=UPI00253F8C1F|nr:hypothetical protein [Streptomyces sp. 2P-4]